MTSLKRSVWAKRATPDSQWAACQSCGFVIRDEWATTERCPVCDSDGAVMTEEAYAIGGDDFIQVPA